MAWFTNRWRRMAIAASALVAAFGVIGVVAIPAAVRWGIETVGTNELGRTVRVEKISANPYTLRVTLKGLTVDGQPGDAAPLLSVREVSVNASTSSLVRRAPVLQAITIDGLTANIVRLEAQRFNFTDIVERLQATPKTSDAPARFSLNNIQIGDSTVNFEDRVTGGKHVLDGIRIGIPFLSSLPTDADITVQPAFAASIDGTAFDLKGETRLFHESRESSIGVRFDGLDIPKYLAFSPVKLNFLVSTGTLHTDLRLAFRQAVPARDGQPAQPAQTMLTGQIQVNGLSLSAPSADAAAPLATVKSVAVAVEAFEPLQRRLVLADVTVDEPEVSVVRDRAGSLNWARLAARPIGDEAVAPASSGPSPAAEPFAVSLKQATVRGGRITFVDESVGRFSQEIVNLQAQAAGMTTAAPDRGTVRLAGEIKDNGSFSLEGELGLQPLVGRLSYAARGVRLAVAARYLANVIDGTLDGRSDVDGTLEIGKTDAGLQLALRELALTGKDIKVRGPSGSGAALDIAGVAVTGATLDLTARSFTADKVVVEGPRVVLRRMEDGSLNWMQVIKAKARDVSQHPQAPAAAPWSVRVMQGEIRRGDITMEDHAVQPAVKLRASALGITAKNIAGDGSERAEFALRTQLGNGGTLAARGDARWDRLKSTVRLDARNLDIATVRPYVGTHLNAVLAKAELSGQGTVSLEQPPQDSALRVAYAGSVRLSNLHMLDSSGESDLLKWQVLDLADVDVKAGDGPPLVALGKVALSDFYARVIVSEKGRLNLADLVRRDGGASPDSPAEERGPVKGADAAARPAADAPASDAPRPTIRIGSIAIVRGNVNFTDNFIKPNYTANMTGLAGTVSTLASDSSEPATMSIAGKIDDDAPVEIGGRLNPLAPMLFLDIEGRTKSVDLPRLTPYAVKYAGYPITKGKLSMDVKYRIDDQKLEASNHLFLDQLTFGDRVDSPTATKLPVLLAVSLLKNTRGEIDIRLPISGSLNDPKFSVGGIVVQVIVNLLTKAVTAPFALLASAFGGSEELGYVEFPPGTATLATTQTGRLDTLAKALNDRPGLKLDIVGRVEPAADADGVRRAKLDSKLRAAKVRQITRGGGESIDPAKVVIGDGERPALIGAVYSDEKIPAKPRNMIGIAKSIPAPEMEQLIMQQITASPEDLRALATARAAAVRDYLESSGKVARERLFLVEPKLTTEGVHDMGAPTRVDFLLK